MNLNIKMTKQKKNLKTVSVHKKNNEDDKKGQNISCQSPFKHLRTLKAFKK
jgi:hypothetical protein